MEMIRMVIGSVILLLALSCVKDINYPADYKTKNIVVVVIDGPRFSETWGDSTKIYIPRLSNQMFGEGVLNDQFYNNGITYTNPGHTAITTGNYQEIKNDGTELPISPSFFQFWNKAYFKDSTSTWLITSKGKLEVLSNCLNNEWSGKHIPSTNCGVDGLGAQSGYRVDSLTLKVALETFTKYQPKLTLINFREPDFSAHQNKWEDYLRGISLTDEYIYRLWDYLQANLNYKDKTTLFVTNDHGRHLDDVKDGFVSHGDDCHGCRHISLLAIGPDFKKGKIVSKERELIDISATIAELMGFEMPTSNGHIMTELFK